MDLLARLQAGDVEGFNNSRGESQRIDLFAAELAGLKLATIDLRGANLDKSDLTESDLTDANLVRAFLSDIDGTGLILDGALAMGAKFRDAWLESADLTGADFSRGDLSGAHLTDTKGEGLRLVGGRMKEANAQRAKWSLSDLSEANLKRTDFTHADLSRAKLTQTRAAGANFTSATLDGVDGAGVNLADAVMVGASLNGARIVEAILTGADLTGADLRHANLDRVDLTNANLTNANLTGASLVDACLDGVTLEGATLDEADLTGVDAAMLGLTEAQTEALANHGARFDPDAPLSFTDSSVAVAGTSACVLWTNPDTETTATVRWRLQREGVEVAGGVLPLSASAVLSHEVVPLNDGFVLVLMVERPAGVVLMGHAVSGEGQIGPAQTMPLGFEPAVLPVMRVVDGAIRIWALSRRGPALIRIRGGADGFEVLGSDISTTARGFLGRGFPVLACKGGVIQLLEGPVAGRPLRTPEGFPARICSAVPLDDKVLAAWPVPKAPRDPGGIRYAWLGGRHQGEPDVLTENPNVTSMDGVADGDRAFVAWSEDHGFGAGSVYMAWLPGTDRNEVEVSTEPVDRVRVNHAADGSPILATTTFSGRLIVLRPDGSKVAVFSDED